MTIEEIKSQLCLLCGNCCKAMILPVHKPLRKSDRDDMVEWLNARGCEVYNEINDTIFVKVNYPCPHLQKSDNKFYCDVYETRSEGCRKFDGSVYPDCLWRKKLVIVEDLRK